MGLNLPAAKEKNQLFFTLKLIPCCLRKVNSRAPIRACVWRLYHSTDGGGGAPRLHPLSCLTSLISLPAPVHIGSLHQGDTCAHEYQRSLIIRQHTGLPQHHHWHLHFQIKVAGSGHKTCMFKLTPPQLLKQKNRNLPGLGAAVLSVYSIWES